MTQFDRLHPAVQHHIVNSLGWPALRPLQEQAIPPLLEGQHGLLIAPTAGGKTEAALFPIFSRMLTEDWRGLSVIYVCPIKALLNNLEARLSRYAELLGRRVELWHGDVGSARRKRIIEDPPDILLTTPESIEVMLIFRREDRRALFGQLRALIVDELHAFAGDDRGWHLLAVTERAAKVAGRDIQRVGLSATIGNPEELLTWLKGSSRSPGVVIRPEANDQKTADVTIDYVGSIPNAAVVISRLHRGEKRLVFCDSRSRVEKIATELRGLGVNTFVSHSSLSVDERRRAELAFSEAHNCVIVATSTLELGLDVGDLDRVIQIDAPRTVSSFLQRIGRTGRREGTSRNCLFLATTEMALLQAAALTLLWSEGYVEPTAPPPEPYHILAQQIMALTLQEGRIGRHTWKDWIGGMPGFAALDPANVEAVIDHMTENGILFEEEGMLSMGEGGEQEFGRRNFLELVSVFTSPPPLQGPARPRRTRHGPRVLVLRPRGVPPRPVPRRPELGGHTHQLDPPRGLRRTGEGQGKVALVGRRAPARLQALHGDAESARRIPPTREAVVEGNKSHRGSPGLPSVGESKGHYTGAGRERFALLVDLRRGSGEFSVAARPWRLGYRADSCR